MKNNQDDRMIESLIEEHARLKGGADDKFLKEIEDRIDAEEKGNVVPITAAQKTQPNKWKLGIGVAACAALGFTGYQLINEQGRNEDVVLENELANRQASEAQAFSDQDPSMKGVERKINGDDKNHDVPTIDESPKELTPPSAEASGVKHQMKKELGGSSDLRNGDPLKSKDLQSHSEGVEQFQPSRDKSVPGQAEPMPLAKDGISPSPGGITPTPRRIVDADGKRYIGGIGGGGNIVSPEERPDLSDLQKKGRQVRGGLDSERYGGLVDNPFRAPIDEETERSTFAIDVDTASYANLRRMINQGVGIPKNAVRIEEMMNYFDYEYKRPEGKHPFAVTVDSAICPWNEDNRLVRVALKGKEIVREKRAASNVVFLLDVSGSMNRANKLPLLKESLKHLLEELNEKDKVSVVVYAGASGLVLPATKMDDVGQQQVLKSLERLSAGGSTAGGQGIKLAYKIAKENFVKDGINRVILATDGDFNVGISDNDSLTSLVEKKAESGVYLSVLGFGNGNFNDEMLESITNKGNGNYNYIDSIKEGRKVLLEDMMGTMVTIAKDVKIQVEFNPKQVKEYRLIGYANRILPNSAFYDKKADAGEIGAGHRVTAFYEIVPGDATDKEKKKEFRYRAEKVDKDKDEKKVVPAEHADELLYVKLAYKQPNQKKNDESIYLAVPLKKDDVKPMSEDFSFASAVALFGMNLRDSEYRNDAGLDKVLELAEKGKGTDGKGHREEFIKLVKKLKEKQ